MSLESLEVRILPAATLPSLAISNVIQAEGSGGSSAFTFNVTRSSPTNSNSSVFYSTANGTAASGSDYTAASGTISFARGETFKTITVYVTGDTSFEGNETFFVNLSSPTKAILADYQGMGTINNDDLAPPTVAINNVTAVEGNSGSSAFAFNVTLSAASTSTVTVPYSTANGTATAGSDYTAASGTLSFAPGETSKSVTVNVTGETLVEANETFTINLGTPTNATLADGQGVGTINNDDSAPVSLPTLAINDATKVEGNSGTSAFTFNVTLSAASTSTVTVPYSTANGTATAGSDYAAAASSTLSFAPGETTKSMTVNVTGETLVEANETFYVNLGTPTNATLADGQGMGIITNDDSTPLPTLAINNVTAIEGNSGNSVFTFNVTLSATSTNTVSVPYSTANGTATAGSDYTAASGTLSFAPGETSKTISVNVTGDTTVEANETFTVNLGTPTNGTLADGQGVGTITNDDSAALPTLSINDVTAAEGNSGTKAFTFSVTLSAISTSTVTVPYSTANGTATAGGDYTATSGTLSFAPGETSKTITVNVTGDTSVEVNETLFVNLGTPTNATLADGQGQATITNDDSAPLPTLAISDVTAAEGNTGTSAFTFTVTLSVASTSTVTVPYSTANGTATAGSDYTAASGTLSFAPGETSKSVTVNVTGETIVESNETFTVNLGTPTNATVADSQGLGTITNDDSAPLPTLSINDVTAAEGNSGTSAFTFTVTLSAASTSTVTVAYNTADGTATAGSDYTTASGTLSFAPGETSKTITISATGDTAVETNETFFVNLSTSTNATVADGQGLGTITNDDPPPLPTLAINDITAVEGNSGTSAFTFTVTLSAASASTVSVPYSTANGTAMAGGDFTSASGTLSFAPGETSKSITVNVTGDTSVEGNETFFVNLGTPTNATVADSQGLGTITNDDSASPASPGIYFDAATGVLTIEGSVYNDSAQVQTFTQTDGSVWLSVVFYAKDSLGNYIIPLQSQLIEMSKVTSIVFHGYAGNDNFYNYSAVPCIAWGGDGNDYLLGGGANDYLYGEAGIDGLHGVEGDDYLDGGVDMDALYGGPGNDVLIAGDAGTNYLFPDAV